MASGKTVRMNLDRTYIYQGVTYGPGPADVPEEVDAQDAFGKPDLLHPAADIAAKMDRRRAADRAAGRVPYAGGGEDMGYVKRTDLPPAQPSSEAAPELAPALPMTPARTPPAGQPPKK